MAGSPGAGSRARLNPETADAITRIWREESARIIGALTRMTRDLDLAQDAAQDALARALERWPQTGIPDNPGAWLMTVAKRRAMDSFRSADSQRHIVAALGASLGADESSPDLSDQVDAIDDDVLRLIFLACHPSLSSDSRAALTLRLVAGLNTAEIARAFVVAESTMGQRISRAKKTLMERAAAFELPIGAERSARLGDVMTVISVLFTEGYTATAGTDWMRPDLAEEALRLARLLAQLMPAEPEAQSLQALLELQSSRTEARTDVDGVPVLLEDQDRSAWSQTLIRRGFAALRRAEQLAIRGAPLGRFYLQAAIASHHARAATASATNWSAIARLYDVLAQSAPGPVVEVNRALAHGRAFGPRAGLAILDELSDQALAGSHLIPSVRADLLARDGQHSAAARDYRIAAELTGNLGERKVLTERGRLAAQYADHGISAAD